MMLLVVPGVPTILIAADEDDESITISGGSSSAGGSFEPSLDFSDERNSQYVGAL